MNESNVGIVTGGTGSVGRELLPLMVRRSFKLGVTYIIPEEATELETELESNLDISEDDLILRRVDTSDAQAVDKFVQEVVDSFGGLNVLVCLVGGWLGGRDVEETDDVRFDRMIDINLRSSFNAVRATIPHLKKQDWGRIVLMGSRHAIETPSGQAAFNIAKAGVAALGRSVAVELSDTNVTCNVLLPSVIDTPTTRAELPYAEYVHWPKPDEIASVIDFLTSHRSAVIDGAEIPVWGAAEI
ncbi:MAG: SDR family NAD(P)-dependent oxidoreductase [Actinobacteria bacterium]|nr:SDR family NAD(P)-dependent oxidoreductase [Actinomycetota bacterium]